ESLLKNTLRASNHRLSRTLYNILDEHDILTLDEYQEYVGKGIEGKLQETSIKIGSASFAGNDKDYVTIDTSVYISTNQEYKGR
ncbi:heavy metal translocating P-type ATPase, partial [Aquimarina celericrescens]|nr:heavy metal translocating P-type ATPase [Aquimarina celericrescens]